MLDYYQHKYEMEKLLADNNYYAGVGPFILLIIGLLMMFFFPKKSEIASTIIFIAFFWLHNYVSKLIRQKMTLIEHVVMLEDKLKKSEGR